MMKLYTMTEAANKLNLTVRSFARYVEMGKIKHHVYGKRTRLFEEIELNRFIKEYKEKKKAAAKRREEKIKKLLATQ